MSTSAEGRLPPSTTHLPYRKSNSVQHASEFSDTPKERSLSVTTQMLGKLQEVEIKRFLTGLGNLTKTGDFQNIESSAIQKRTYLKENETLKYHSTCLLFINLNLHLSFIDMTVTYVYWSVANFSGKFCNMMIPSFYAWLNSRKAHIISAELLNS